jgi:hypothetical protein
VSPLSRGVTQCHIRQALVGLGLGIISLVVPQVMSACKEKQGREKEVQQVLRTSGPADHRQLSALHLPDGLLRLPE